MKFQYQTDACSGDIEAESLQDAFEKIMAEEKITPRKISDGAWIRVTDGTETIEIGC